MSSIVHTISDRMPSTASGPTRPAVGGCHGLAQRVERAGADVAVDDADRAERQRPEMLVGMPVLGGPWAAATACAMTRQVFSVERRAAAQNGRGLYTASRVSAKARIRASGIGARGARGNPPDLLPSWTQTRIVSDMNHAFMSSRIAVGAVLCMARLHAPSASYADRAPSPPARRSCPRSRFSPFCQNSGLEASRPKGASSSEWCLEPPAFSISKYFATNPGCASW